MKQSRPALCKVAAAAMALLAASISPALAEGANPEAAAHDVESIDAILAAVYDVISGPAGKARDWDRFRSLFHKDARLIPYSASLPAGANAITPEDYVERASSTFAESGFFETEIGRKTDRFGDIAQVFSAYEGKRQADDAEPFVRGVNSFQLLHHNDRWWIVTIYWQAETEDNPIPDTYIKID